MVLVLFANTNFKMYLLRVLSLIIQELRFNVSVSVSMSGSGAVDLGAGVGSYQPGVYVPLKALFLVQGHHPAPVGASSFKHFQILPRIQSSSLTDISVYVVLLLVQC